MTGTVLIVDDDALHRRMLGTLLERKLSLHSIEAENGRDGLAVLKKTPTGTIKLVILDLNMPVMDGMEALSIIAQQYPALPVIMLTGTKDIDDAIRAMKAGATDFLSKPYEADRLAVTVRNALKIGVLTKEVTRLKRKESGALSFSDLIGHDGGLAATVAVGRKAAQSDIPVLITGETGVGKELFARALHGESERSGNPFIAVNCGAIPATLVESTLFGHEKGAFTGAIDKAAGKFREAEGGTIFLDEVGELPLEVQVKLLRVLQQKEVEPVGAGRTVPVNVRVISATNRDLAREVKAGRFREDLYFRLNVLEMDVPPLRQRKQDIPALVNHFVERFSVGRGGKLLDVNDAALEKLTVYSWSGNVRELENAIHRAVVLCENAALSADDFALPPPKDMPQNSTTAHPFLRPDGTLKTIEDIENDAIDFALSRNGQNMTEAAKALGMAKSTLYRKIRE